MPTAIRQLWAILLPSERRKGYLALVLASLMALVEMASVASVMPFLAVLGNPAVVEGNRVLHEIYQRFGFEDHASFLIALGVFSCSIVVFSSLFRSFADYALCRYAHMRRATIASRLLRSYLRQPYPFFLNRNTADLSKSILAEVDQVINNVVTPTVTLVSRGVLLVAIVLLLVLVNPVIALTVAGALGLSYLLIYLGARGMLARIGPERRRASQACFRAATEALGGIKEIKVAGVEGAYMSRFEEASVRQSSRLATNDVLGLVPRYLIEGVGFGGLIGFALVLLTKGGSLGEVLPILGLYGFAGYRMLPAAQSVFGAISQLRFGASAIEEIHGELVSAPGGLVREAGPLSRRVEPLPLRHSITFERLEFRYPHAERAALTDISLKIEANTTVGFIGTTGAGKTTLIDVLLGLLAPTRGGILIDGQPLEGETVLRWQRNIGYVPQHLYLADASVAENIAFGVAPEDIDLAAVERAARAAQIHDFIVGSMPSGYQTEVGERGVRLSGGQRQRIGIARALYHDPAVLVLDEATSALDSVTEAAVMNAIKDLHGTKTIIAITHRLASLSGSDRVFRLEGGRLVDQGRPRDVLHEAGLEKAS